MSTADRLAILEAIQRYSYATDSRDAEAYAALFSLRGVFEVTSATRPQPFIHAEGRDGIRDWVEGAMARWGDVQTRHHRESGTVFDALSADAARTRTMLLESRMFPDGRVPRPWTQGVYTDTPRISRTPDVQTPSSPRTTVKVMGVQRVVSPGRASPW